MGSTMHTPQPPWSYPMSPNLIRLLIAYVAQHSPVVPAVYDAAADAVMVPEEFYSADIPGYRVNLHTVRTVAQCRDALGY